MPGEVAWSLENRESGVFEILFPDEATSFRLYDADYDVYRVLIIHCVADDLQTKIFQFEAPADIDMDKVMEQWEPYCDDNSLFDEMEHTNGCLIETHAQPDIRMEIFIGHQAMFSDS